MKSYYKVLFMCIVLLCLPVFGCATEAMKWKHLSTVNGDLPTPNDGKQQTSTVVCDIDKDGINDFVVTERTEAPAVVWYRRVKDGWEKYVIEDTQLRPEAGSDSWDIDGDGDIDIMAGGDGRSNEVWWWENPYPNFKADKGWKRRTIKNFGKNKHHDQMFGDFDGDGKAELVFWNQGGRKLYLAEIPDNVKEAESWKCTVIYSYANDSEMEPRGKYPFFKGTNDHEGLAKADIDGDGKEDIIGGGRWFKHIEGTTYQENIVDAGYTFSRAVVGDLIKGGRPEIVLVVGDGWAPMVMYEWKKTNPRKPGGTWISKKLIEEADCVHSVKILDFNGDGNLDIWFAEMRLYGKNPDAKNMVLLGDGAGNFEEMLISSGIALHESKMADLDGDGDMDVLGKPYGWETPRLDIWINQGK